MKRLLLGVGMATMLSCSQPVAQQNNQDCAQFKDQAAQHLLEFHDYEAGIKERYSKWLKSTYLQRTDVEQFISDFEIGDEKAGNLLKEYRNLVQIGCMTNDPAHEQRMLIAIGEIENVLAKARKAVLQMK